MPPAVVRVSGVALDRSELAMTVGDREFLTAQLSPQNADNQAVTWSSSDAAVATVDEHGEVNALVAGRTTIGVRTLDGGFSASCAVTVAAADDPVVRVSGVSLNRSELAMTVGDREFLTAQLSPQNADNQAVTWSSSDAAIATVDEHGEVNALAAGRTTISVRTLDGDFSASCAVTVSAADPADPDDPKNPGEGDPENPDHPPLSGTVGSLAWSFDTASGVLTLSGSGDLPDWPAAPGNSGGASEAAPWSAVSERIATLVLPAAIGRIGANNFAGCANLTTVEIAATKPPELDSRNFEAQYYDTLVVPKSSFDLYRSHPAWYAAFGYFAGRE